MSKITSTMWKVDESGLFQFSDATYNPAQMMLFEVKPDYYHLKKIILQNFKGKPVSIAELENFVLTQTPFRETHYKRQILAPMEKIQPPEIKVKCPDIKRKKGTFPVSCIVEFL